MPRWPGNRSPRAPSERGAGITTVPCPQPPPTVAAGRSSRNPHRRLAPGHLRTRVTTSAQHRSHQGSGPSPEISHRNPVYLTGPDGNPES